jgi:hypothetical protein
MNEELRGKDLGGLCDLLVDKTMQLLKVLEQKTDPARIHELKTEVEMIQSAIKAKQATANENGHNHL